ncbi:hypothetical protein PSECIP111854_03561 [Pseudoalteromonas sp. CIP111854]|uniref:NACHT N-terminal Helical domain-containing protein n=1 Tax=Pseudoalteromonas holothuriae TaxID=2963714 RepID=A0A9W4R3L1_9GAMM|nr:pentapeptide repeat-containing protein [Pseudoalteromonas sp. CIP111854]CAH9064881.1 hypothetical protein PSECIP111854_03561 [Pseudoalteromonas sp. CIP111854]
MSKHYDLTLEQPVSVWNKELSLPIRELFKNLGKAAISGVFADSKGMYENLVEAGSVMGFADKPAHAAWVLVFKSLQNTLYMLVPDYQELFASKLKDKELEQLSHNIEEQISQIPLGLTVDFFTHPERLPLFEHIKPAILYWLESLGMRTQDAAGFFVRLQQSFALALHKEWNENRAGYLCIAQQLDNPFAQASKIEQRWQLYNAWLQEQVNQRMFAEAFSLSQVYVKLNAFYKVNAGDDEEFAEYGRANKYQKQVVDLHNEIQQWVINFDKTCPVRVISGGPGSGKSSFAKMFAAHMVKLRSDIKVVFIPLHYFDPSDDLIHSVERYVELDTYLPVNPLNKEYKTQRVLLIFDGLDELAMQGKLAAETANHFVEEVLNKVARFNDAGYQWQALITGRDMAIQSVTSKLRGLQQQLHVLPYFVEQRDEGVRDKKEYIDPNKLLEQDLRDVWWQNYGRAKGIDYQGLPESLAIEQLQPITQEPLLNYLVALSFERGEINFNDTITLNQIYQDLLDAVYERQWDEHGSHKQARDIEKRHFIRVLEEIALAVWHGNGRVASIAKIQQQCEASRVTQYLDVFQESTKSGISRLLTAFYFRQSEQLDGQDKTFEFTHKSFGEYLIARRITREVKLITDEMKRNIEDPDTGYDQISALERWAKLCGPTPLDKYVFGFLVDEISLQDDDRVRSWQSCFANLFSHTLRKSMPVEKLGLGKFLDMAKYARNAEVALLAVHHGCALLTRVVTNFNFEDDTCFLLWFNRTIGYGDKDDIVPVQCLSYIHFSHTILRLSDFAIGNFFGSDISSADFYKSELDHAVLVNVDASTSGFSEASLCFANCSHSNFQRADLESANFLESHFVSSDLSFADLSFALVVRSNFSNAKLVSANFLEASLKDAKLINVDAKHASFNQADLGQADLTNANLTGADLTGANLKGAILKNTILVDVDLSEVDLEGVDLSEAILELPE